MEELLQKTNFVYKPIARIKINCKVKAVLTN